MNRLWIHVAAGLMGMLLPTAGAMAQDTMRVYIAQDAMSGRMGQVLEERLNSAYPQAVWDVQLESECKEELRALVLSDRTPTLAICAPGEALAWAKEGMLLPLQQAIGQQERIQPQVLQCCVQGEALFMAPLVAQHRQMAVNVKRFQAQKMDDMLDELAHPVWYPMEFYQILEEFMMADEPALDIWPAEPETSVALEALVQAMFGGTLLSEDGTSCLVNSPEIRAGLRWLADAADSGLIACAQNRDEALRRFVAGETAMFPDWTQEEAERLKQTLEDNGVQVKTVPYPSALGLPVRAFEVTGVCAFESGDAQTDALAVQAAALLYADEQALLGQRSIWRDGAAWLPSLDTGSYGATLRSLLCDAMRQVMEGECGAGEALEQVRTAMDVIDTANN